MLYSENVGRNHSRTFEYSWTYSLRHIPKNNIGINHQYYNIILWKPVCLRWSTPKMEVGFNDDHYSILVWTWEMRTGLLQGNNWLEKNLDGDAALSLETKGWKLRAVVGFIFYTFIIPSGAINKIVSSAMLWYSAAWKCWSLNLCLSPIKWNFTTSYEEIYDIDFYIISN